MRLSVCPSENFATHASLTIGVAKAVVNMAGPKDIGTHRHH